LSLRLAQADKLKEWSENQALAKAARTEAERELRSALSQVGRGLTSGQRGR
jgi:hypothetical protein